MGDSSVWPDAMPEGSVWEWTAPGEEPSSMILHVQGGQLIDVADGFTFPLTPDKDVPGKRIALFRPDLGERICRRMDLEQQAASDPELATAWVQVYDALNGILNGRGAHNE